MKRTSIFVAALILSAGFAAGPDQASAGGYPTNGCVSKKQKATGKFCQSALTAWSKWHKDPAADPVGTERDASILAASDKLSASWTKAEATATKKNADCAVTTDTVGAIASDVETAVDALQASLGMFVDPADQSCRSKALSAAAKLCSGLIGANSKYIKLPAKDPDKVKLGEGTTSAGTKFTGSYDGAAADCTNAIPASATVLASVDALSDDIVEATTTAPNEPLTFTQVLPGASVTYLGQPLSPRCSRNTPYSFFYKRGTENKLLMYYQGGGACWNDNSCNVIGTFKDDAGAGDNPDLVGTGFADPDNALNLFKDWHVVFVSYCTGDVHWGSGVGLYTGGTVYHYGRQNAAVAEKWARERFLDPEFVFVTGSSAGSYGAIMNSAYLQDSVYPQSEFGVLGDAGIGVITQEWLDDNISNWNVEANLPTFIPGIEPPIEQLSMVEVIEALANEFPENRFASYHTAYDGSGGGQAAFYHVMKNPNNVVTWAQWWGDQCEWTACARQFVQEAETRAPTNYRSYTGAGSRHTVYGADKLYTDVTGLVPPITLRDWVSAMIEDDVGWVTVDCEDGGDCDLVDTCQGGTDAGLPCVNDGECDGGGECELDPRPSPLAAPYEPGGVVNCAPTVCPCGPTGVNCP